MQFQEKVETSDLTGKNGCIMWRQRIQSDIQERFSNEAPPTTPAKKKNQVKVVLCFSDVECRHKVKKKKVVFFVFFVFFLF